MDPNSCAVTSTVKCRRQIRPVPLWQHMLVGNRLFDLYDPRTVAEGGKRVNPEN